MSTIKTNAILDASGGNTVTINSVTPTAYNTMGKNRIINGAMEIDQRNAGASVTIVSNPTYTVDRWRFDISVGSKLSAQQSSVAPVGFSNSMLITSLSAYTPSAGDQFVFNQLIEGFNTSDLNWGTANAKTVTLSFWVRSSLTGTFGGSIRNNTVNRSYVFSYTINSANTWEQKTITIAGDTTGTWETTNSTGVRLSFSLGSGSSTGNTAGSWYTANYRSVTGETQLVGTSGATFYITGVQLEVGSVATEFERRPYGTELALCQRYYQRNLNPIMAVFWNSSSCVATPKFVVPMRASPTISAISGVTQTLDVFGAGNTTYTTNYFDHQSVSGFRFFGAAASNYPTGQPADSPNDMLQASAEL